MEDAIVGVDCSDEGRQGEYQTDERGKEEPDYKEIAIEYNRIEYNRMYLILNGE